MSRKIEIFRLEDRVLFEAGAADAVIDAAAQQADMNGAEAAQSADDSDHGADADHNAADANTDANTDANHNAADTNADADHNSADANADADTNADHGSPNTDGADTDGVIYLEGMDSDADADADDADASLNPATDDGAVTGPDFASNANLADEPLPGAPIPVIFDTNGEAAASTISTDRELVVINSSVADKDAVLESLAPNQEALILESGTDGLDELNAYLDEHADTQYSAIHFVTHGNDGYFSLNGEVIDRDNVDADAWKDVGEHLTADGDLLFYGCNLAENQAGQELCGLIADASGADVAASTDTTGVSGDWDLEYRIGDVTADSLTIENYEHNLTSYTVNTATGDASVSGTLAWAVSQANSNAGSDEIIFSAGLDGTTIQVGARLTISGDVTISGNGEANTILDGGSVNGIFSISSGVNVTLDHMTIQNCVSVSGGAIIHSGGVLTLDHVTFADNQATNGNGGAVYVNTQTGAVQASHTTFTGNSAAAGSGGAVYFNASSTGTSFFTDSIFTGNTAKAGGAIYNQLSASNIGTLTISDTVFTDNSATTGDGGAVCEQWGDGALTVERSTFTNNSAAGYGGALASGSTYGRTTTITDTVFTGNTAQKAGAFCFSGTSRLDLERSTFTGNAASSATTSDGGAIYFNTVKDVTILDSTFTGNTATRNGGAIFLVSTTQSATLCMANTTITGNTANYCGGFFLQSLESTAYLVNCIVTGNTGTSSATNADIRTQHATSTVLAYYTAYGNVGKISGTITMDPETCTVKTAAEIFGTNTLADNGGWTKTLAAETAITGTALTVYRNAATGQAEGFSFLDSTSTQVDCGVVTGTAETHITDQRGYYIENTQLGAYNSASYVAWSGSADPRAEGNTFYTSVQNGIDAMSDGTLYLADSRISIAASLSVTAGKTISIVGQGAHSTVLDGGNSGGTATDGVRIMNVSAGATASISNIGMRNAYNTDAESSVGAGAIRNEGTLNLTGMIFSNNQSKYAGAVANKGGTVTIADSEFLSNSTISGVGGAIYNQSGTMTISGSTFEGNSNGDRGGAIFANGTVTITNSVFRSNAVDGTTGGGAIYAPGKLTLDSVSFIANETKGNGGAVFILSTGSLNAQNVSFLANGANKGGSAVYNTGNAAIANARFSNHNDIFAAAVYNTKTLTLTNATFDGNHTTYWGVYSNIGANATGVLVNTTFTDNSGNAAIYVEGNLTVVNATVTGNQTRGISIQTNNLAHSLTLVNSIVTGNTQTDVATAQTSGNELNSVTIYNSLYGTAALDSSIGNLKIFNSRAGVTAADVFAGTVTETVVDGVTQKTIDLKTGGLADGTGMRVYHNADWTALALSKNAGGALSYLVGTTGADTLVATDQRGVTIADASSIGAVYLVHSGNEVPSLLVTTASDTVDATDNEISLREAIAYAEAMNAATSGAYTITVMPGLTTLALDSSGISITTAIDLTVDGGADCGYVTILAGANQRVFSLSGGANLTLYHTILQGNGKLAGTTATEVSGGLVLMAGGTFLTVDAAVLRDGQAGYGGAIAAPNGGATVTVRNDAKFLNNKANVSGTIYTGVTIYPNGGAIHMAGSGNVLTISNALFQSNSSNDQGGTLQLNNTTLTIEDTVFDKSSAGSQGSLMNFMSGTAVLRRVSVTGNTGGTYGSLSVRGGTVYIENSSFLGNAGASGAFIDVQGAGTLYMTDTTVAGTTANGCLNMNGGTAYVVNSILTSSASNATAAIRGSSANTGKLTLVHSLYSGAENATFNANSTGNWNVPALAVFPDKNQSVSIPDYTASGADLTAHVETARVTPSANGFAAYYGVETAFDPTAKVLYYYDSSASSWKNIATGVIASVDEAWKITTDQTGAARTARSVGAISVADPGGQPESFDSAVVTTKTDIFDLSDGLLSLREAMIYAGAGGTITFDRTVFTAQSHTITLNEAYGEIVLNTDVVIDGDIGNGNRVVFKVPVTYAESLEQGTTVTASRLFTVGSFVNATIRNMEIYGGSADNGGTIYVQAGQLTLENAIVGDSRATKYGGAIAVFDPNNSWTKMTTLTIRNSIIRSSSAGERGGLIDVRTDSTNSDFAVYIYDSLLTDGTAGVGGGLSIWTAGGASNKGGCYAEIDGTTFLGNRTLGTTNSKYYAGSGWNVGAAIVLSGMGTTDTTRFLHAVVTNSTFTENATSRSTFDVSGNVILNLADSTLAGNNTVGALTVTANGVAAQRLGRVQIANSIILGAVTGSNAPTLTAYYTIFSETPTGFLTEITETNGNKIGGDGITFDDLFTGEWTAADGRVAQTLRLTVTGYAATAGHGALVAVETWDNFQTAGFADTMWISTDGTSWIDCSTGTAGTDPNPDYLLTTDQVGRSRSAYDVSGAVYCVGAYTFALEEGSLVVNGVCADNPYDGVTTFNEALTYAKTLLPAATDEVAITFSSAYFNDTNTEDARTITLTATLAYNAAMYNFLAIRGNGKVLMTTATGVQHFFSVSGAANTLTVEGITFKGDVVGASSAGTAGKFLDSSNANLKITLTDVSMSGFAGTVSGNVFKISGDGLVMNITGGTYTGMGTKTGDQGAFLYYYKSNGSITLKDAVFSNYMAGSQGGMFYLNGSNNTITLDGATLSGNSANNGGAIYAKGSGFTLALRNGASLSGNSALNGSGGAVYIEGAGATVSIEDSTVSNNSAFGNNIYGGAIDVNSANAVVTVENSTFSGNAATGTGTNSTYGGALSIRGTGEKVTLNNVTAENNSSWLSGGFLFLSGQDFTFTLDGGSYTGNTARASTNSAYAGGGALHLSGTSSTAGALSATIRNAVFSQNTAGYDNNSSSGGAVYFSSKMGTLDISYTTFDRNVSSFFGGALAISNAVFTGDHLTFTGNEGRRGGALMFQTEGAINKTASFITNSLFDGNSASVTGGGIFLSGAYSSGSCELCVENTTFINNYAKYVGGALSMGDRSYLNLLNCTVVGNKIGSAAGVNVPNDSSKTMTTGGAGVYLGQNAPDMNGQQNGNGGPLTLENCIVVGNTDNADDAAGTHAAADIRSTSASYYGDYNVIGADAGTKTITGTNNTSNVSAGTVYDLTDPTVYDSVNDKYLVDTNHLLQVSAAGAAIVNTDKLVYGRYYDSGRNYYAFSTDDGGTWQGRKDASLVSPAATPVKLMTDPTGLYRVGWRTAGAAQYLAALAWREYEWDGDKWVDGITIYTDLTTAFITDSAKIASGEDSAPEVYLAGMEIDLGGTDYSLVNSLSVVGTDNTILINGNFDLSTGVTLTVSNLTAIDWDVTLASGSNAVIENTLIENAAGSTTFHLNGGAALALVNSTYYGSSSLSDFSGTSNSVTLADSTVYQTDGGFWTLNAGVTLNAVNSIVAAYLNQDANATINAAYSVFLNAENELGPFDLNVANTFGVSAESLFGSAPVLDRGALVILSSSAAWTGGAQTAFNASTMSAGYTLDNGASWTTVSGTSVVKSDWLRNDQRGEFRLNSEDGSAVGAYSGLAEAPSTVVTIAGERVDAYDGYISFREAAMYAQQLGGGTDNTVTFDVNAINANATITTEYGETVDLSSYFVYDSGKVTLYCSGVAEGYPQSVYAVAGTVLAIDGAGAVTLTQMSGVTLRLFEVCGDATLDLANLTIKGTKGGTKLSVEGSLVYTSGILIANDTVFCDSYSSGKGTLLRYVSGSMTLTGCVFSGASGGGSAVHIENGGGTNSFIDCVFSDNAGGETLHLHNGSRNYFTSCVIKDNTSTGQLIYTGYGPTVDFTSCVIKDNTVSGILIGSYTTNTFRIADSTISGNRASALISVSGYSTEITGSIIADNTATGDDLIAVTGTGEKLMISGTAITGNTVSTAGKALIRGGGATAASHSAAVELANNTIFNNTASTLFRTTGTAAHYAALTSNTIVSNTFSDAAISGVNANTDLVLLSNIILGNANGDVCVTAAKSYNTGYNLTGSDTSTVTPAKALNNLNEVTLLQVFGTASPELAADGKSIVLPATSLAVYNGILTASYYASNSDFGAYVSLDGASWTNFLDDAAVKTTAELTAKNYSIINSADIRGTVRGTLTAAGSYDTGSNVSAISGDYRTAGTGELTWQASSFEEKIVIDGADVWVAIAGWRLAAPDDTASSLTVVAGSTLVLDATDRTVNSLTVEENAALTGGAGALILPDLVNNGTITLDAGDTSVSGTASSSGVLTLGAGGFTVESGEFTNSGTLTQGVSAGAITVGNGTDTAKMTNTGSLLIGGLITLASGASVDFSAAGNSVTYNGGDQTILAATYCDLTLSAASASTKTLAGDVSVTGIFTAHGTDNTNFLTLDGGSHTLTVSDPGTRTAQSGRVTYTDIRNLTAVNGADADELLYLDATNTVSGTTGIRVVIPVSQVDITSGGSIVYGKTLADATVAGTVTARGTTVAGAFAYTDGTVKPDTADSDVTEYDLTFTPTNSAYLVDAGTSTVHVAKASITIGALAADGKTYNGATGDAVLTAQTLTGSNGETFQLTGTGDYADSHANDGISVSFDDLTLTAAGTAQIANYSFVYQGNAVTFNTTTGKMTSAALTGSGDIAKRHITVTFKQLTKTYDGTDTLALADNMYEFANLSENETLTLTATSGLFSTYRAAVDGTTVSFTGLALGDAAEGDGLAADYLLVNGEDQAITSVSGLDGTISKAALTVTISDSVTEGGITNGDSFVYGAKGHASLVGETGTLADTDAVSGAISIQTTAGLSSAEYYNAGDHTATATVVIVNTAEGDADVTDCYDISFAGVTGFTVTQKTLSNVLAGSKVYDASAEFSGATAVLGADNGVVGADDVSSVLQAVTLAGADKGDYTVASAGNAALSGTDAGNYLLPEDLTVTVTARQVVLTGVGGHVYGETDVYTDDNLVSGQYFSGYLATDIGLSGAGEYAAGTHHVSGQGTIRILGVDGSDVSDNYDLTLGENLSFEIARKTISASDIENLNKTYDATTEFTFSAGSLTGVLLGDTVLIDNATVQTDSPNAGIYQVSLDSVELQGADAANYILSGNAEITVNQRQIVVTSISGLYGEPETLVLGIGGEQGLVGTDTLTGRLETDLGLSADGEYMAGLHTISGLGTFAAADGNNGNNYQVVLASSIPEFTIDKRSVTVTANPVSYDAASGGSVTLTYSVSGDKLFGTDKFGGELACPTLDTAANGEYAITQGSVAVMDHGAVSKNYSVTFVGAAVTVSGVGSGDTDGGLDAFQYPEINNGNISSDMYSIVVNGQLPQNGVSGASSDDPTAFAGRNDTRMISTTEYQLDRSVGFLLASENAALEEKFDGAFPVNEGRRFLRGELRGDSDASTGNVRSALLELLDSDSHELRNEQARKLGLTVFDSGRIDDRFGCSVDADELSGSGELQFFEPGGSLSPETADFSDAADELPPDVFSGKAALCRDDLDQVIEEMLAI